MTNVFCRPLTRATPVRIIPDRVDPRTYLSLNRFEQVMEENQFDMALRIFRSDWRQRLIDIVATHHLDFSNECCHRLDGRKLYGMWWGPGRLPRRITDSLTIVQRVIRNTSVEDLFQ